MDIAQYRCRECGFIVQGRAVVDPTFSLRVNVHLLRCEARKMEVAAAMLRQEAKDLEATIPAENFGDL